ncbi:MAG: hypothetical protein NZZ60_07730 [Bacteroidia bacterium]|nr:hypothetical protein [Bacteroidia bacterium]MCX7652680.1 hypothetical protein [Bacteroidia bacterium]MDW8416966.1 hypothetical protein [Bacteroidia bacterium]
MLDKLREIAQAAQNGAPPEELVAQLEALHEEVSADEQSRMDFEREVLQVADGVYLPHIFWIYLGAFLDDKDTYRPFLEYVFQVYSQLPPSPFVDKRMRLLLYVYLTEESAFYLDKLEAYLKKYARPDKYSLINDIRSYIQKNPNTVGVFRQKFALLKGYMPNFEMLSMALPHLRASIAQLSSSE